MVVNPVGREVEKVIRRLRPRITGMRERIARTRRPGEREMRRAEPVELDREIDELKATRKSLPTHIRVADPPESEARHTLPVEERLLLNIIRMIAYRAETRMMQPLHHRARQGPERQETAPRHAHIRRRCHPRTRTRNSAGPVPRSRQ